MPVMNQRTLGWLLEESNPGVRVRALSGLCELPDHNRRLRTGRCLVVRALDQAQDLSWVSDTRPLTPVYNLTALAESGLTRGALRIDPLVDRILDGMDDFNCGDFMALRALVMLGYGDDRRLRHRLAQAVKTQLPDGGWLCLHRLNRMSVTPKSCIKASVHALLLASEIKKRGTLVAGTDELVRYFLRRRLFYRTDEPECLVLDGRPGNRMIDASFPIQFQRVGLPVLLEAFANLGVGRAPELHEAWGLLESKQDREGRVKLEGTLAKSYLPKERVGRPGKWVTLYAWLAYRARDSGTP